MAAPKPATKTAYDPVKSVEGTFNGSVTRIAYVLKDPVNYGGSTRTVLAICAKRFQDALDDCEIQLLDTKWYLESQLHESRSRREAHARETGTSTKRKYGETEEPNEPNADERSTAKKAKIAHEERDTEPEEPSKHNDVIKSTQLTQKAAANTAKLPEDNQVADRKEDQNKDAQAKQIPSKPDDHSNAPTKEVPPQPQSSAPPAQDDFAKPTPPQATPTGTNDDFNFESVFGEPTGGDGIDGGGEDNDLGFDFTAGDFTGGNTDNTTNMNEQDQDQDQASASLDAFLPGLATYANQTDDHPLNLGNDANNNNKNNSNSNQQDTSALPSFPTDFDLPTIDGPNVFDDFLNESGLDAGGNFDSNDPNDTSLIDDIDFDSMF